MNLIKWQIFFEIVASWMRILDVLMLDNWQFTAPVKCKTSGGQLCCQILVGISPHTTF
jgi:hypothetical protein